MASTSLPSSLSSVPPQENTIPISDEKVSAGPEESSLSLVGYSIGPYHSYGALISSMRKTWSLKGNLQLLPQREGFFLLRFSASDDFEMALSGVPWFFLDWPFFLQKWSPNPKRDELSSIPIWVKIHDLPLCCWTPNGISKIASFIGIPLTVDTPTAQKTRLTFARVCIEVTSKSLLPDIIPISLAGESVMLEVEYEWKPTPCELCDSLVHSADLCPSNKPSLSSTADPPPRGKSTNRRKPRRRTRTRPPPPKSSTSAYSLRPPKNSTNTTTTSSQPSSSPLVTCNPEVQETHIDKHYIPNLNSPSQEIVIPPQCPSTCLQNNDPFDVLAPNKLEVLQTVSDIALAIETNVVITAPQINTSP